MIYGLEFADVLVLSTLSSKMQVIRTKMRLTGAITSRLLRFFLDDFSACIKSILLVISSVKTETYLGNIACLETSATLRVVGSYKHQ